MLSKYRILLIILLICTACANHDFNKEDDNQKETIDEANKAQPKEEPVILEALAPLGINRSLSFEDVLFKFNLPISYSEVDTNRNYLSLTTVEEFGPRLVFECHPITASDIVKANSDILSVYTNLFKGWIIDRKEFISLGGMDFSLIMAADTLKQGEIDYELILTHISKVNSFEMRLKDGSLRYNYSPEEALMQMKAAANELLRSIQISNL